MISGMLLSLLLLLLLLLLLFSQKGINREVNQQLVIYISTIFEERHKMPPYTSGICLKSYMYNDSLKRHMRTKHSTDESGEKIKKRKVIKRSTENDGFRNVICNICGQVFGSQKHLETHIRHKNHVQFEDPKNMIACIASRFFLHLESLTYIYVKCILLQKNIWSLIEVK